MGKAVKILALIVLCGVLGCCYQVGMQHDKKKADPSAKAMNDAKLSAYFPAFQMTRSDEDTDATDAKPMDLAQAEGECLITEGGKYLLKGELRGRIRIAAEEETVHLFLAGVTVQSTEGPALLAESTGKVILTLAEGTENRFSDSGRYQHYLDQDACLFGRGDITINGAGTLRVNGLYRDGIRSSNMMKVAGGQIFITCKRNGIHGSDGIHVSGGRVQISSEKNGFRTTKHGAEGRGNLIISGGEHQIIAGRYAFLVSRADLYVYDCRILDKSVVGAYNVGGRARIESGCIQ